MGTLEIRAKRMINSVIGTRCSVIGTKVPVTPCVTGILVCSGKIKVIVTFFVTVTLALSGMINVFAAPVSEVQLPSYRIWYSGNDGGPWRIISTVINRADKESERSLAIDLGPAGSLDSANAFSQTVLKDERGLTMWYSGYDGLNWRILRATSLNGARWEKQGLAISLGASEEFDSTHMTYPFVLKDDNLYKMWYAAYDGKSHWRIGYADSQDGIIFKNQKAVLDIGPASGLDCEHVYTPVVVKQGGIYTMFYAGYGGFPRGWRILRATSVDGINWRKQGLALDLGQPGDFDSANLLPGSVIYSQGLFKMWYWAHGSNWRVLSAVSKNGIDWEKKGLVLDLGEGRSLDCRGLAVPAVVEESVP